MRVGILTISDRSSRGERPDDSGPAIREFAEGQLSAQVVAAAVIPDDLAAIRDTLAAWSDAGQMDILFTTGGTGFAPRDQTPEGTRAVIEREAPGLAEAARPAPLLVTAML
jgi:molybdenum cofactor synthesis domain-containing protein